MNMMYLLIFILDALIEAIESGTSSIDYMDDVGQTLLNWASAFGTQEMVEYLCQKGADVNKGQRSSSLHYAACFGRPQIAKVLLRFGANPDLRDEDGKTPLDKARERNDEGHREVASILQSPADWITSPSTEDTSAATASEEEQQPSIADQGTGKSFSEALILALVNPKYDKRLFIESPGKYKFRSCCVQMLF